MEKSTNDYNEIYSKVWCEHIFLLILVETIVSIFRLNLQIVKSFSHQMQTHNYSSKKYNISLRSFDKTNCFYY
jgi:hypothetical protein